MIHACEPPHFLTLAPPPPPIPATSESQRLHLLAVTADGRRVYFSTNPNRCVTGGICTSVQTAVKLCLLAAARELRYVGCRVHSKYTQQINKQHNSHHT